jgi:transcription initiation factor TFIID subunit 10
MSSQDASTSQQGHAAYPVAPGGNAEPAPENSQAVPQAGGSGSAGSAQPQSRQAAEEARKDRTLAEFMLMLDEYEPLVRLKVFMRWDQPDGVYGRFRTR